MNSYFYFGFKILWAYVESYSNWKLNSWSGSPQIEIHILFWIEM